MKTLITMVLMMVLAGCSINPKLVEAYVNAAAEQAKRPKIEVDTPYVFHKTEPVQTYHPRYYNCFTQNNYTSCSGY